MHIKSVHDQNKFSQNSTNKREDILEEVTNYLKVTQEYEIKSESEISKMNIVQSITTSA